MKPILCPIVSITLALTLVSAFAPSAARALDPDPAELGLPSLPPARLKELLKPLPPRSPDDAIKAMEIIPGFHAEMVAAEPDVINPVAGAIDENGLFYVCELIDYPYKAADGEKPKGRVRLLEDLDGDGRYEKATVFADGLLWPAGVAPWKGGVFVTAPPDIWYLKDTDGDRVADVRDKVFTGFGTSGAQYIMNNLQWGLDHKIYLSVAGNGGTVTQLKHPEVEPMNVGGGDVRFDPETLALERISGGKQFGNTFDDWGNRFMCDESDALIHVVLPLEYLQRNPHLRVESVKNTVVGGPTPIFRISPVETWRAIRSARRLTLGERDPGDAGLSHNVLDGVAGTTIYRGDAYAPQYRGTVFVNDAQNNLIHHRTLEPDGVTFKSERIEQGTEFLRSRDNWFRPVNLLNTPDGTLYSFDLAREILEAVHIPMDVVQYLDLTSGRDRGRIWRLAPDGFKPKPPPKLGNLSTPDLVALLESDNGWTRDTAHRLIYERKDPAVEDELRFLHGSAKPTARIHALWSLAAMRRPDRMKVLRITDFLTAMDDKDEHVRELGIAFAMPTIDLLGDVDGIVESVNGLADDPSMRVRFQCAMAAGLRDGISGEAVSKIALRDYGDRWMRTALLCAATYHNKTTMINAMLGGEPDEKFLSSPDAPAFVEALASMSDQREGIQNSDSPRAWLVNYPDIAIAYALGNQEAKVVALRDHSKGSFPEAEAYRLASERAQERDAPMDSRVRAVRLLGYQPHHKPSDVFGWRVLPDGSKEAIPTPIPLNTNPQPVLAALLGEAVPPVVQVEAVRSLARLEETEVAPLLLAPWRESPPPVREEIIKVLLDKPERTAKLLDAIEAGDIAPPEIPLTARKKMLDLKDDALKARAEKLLPSAPSAERQEVITKYKPALSLPGHPDAGLAVFTKTCAQCHKIGNVGHETGPNLALAAKPADELLMHILDPNHEVKPQYIQYLITLKDDTEVDGVIASDTPSSVTIRRPNEELVIPRAQIASITSSKLSLMPEGLEQDLSLQDMADLIAYLLGNQYDRGTAGKSGPEGTMLHETRK